LETIELNPSRTPALLWRTGCGPDTAGGAVSLTQAKSNYTILVDGKPLWLLFEDATVSAEPRSYKEGVTDILFDLVPCGPAVRAVTAVENSVKAALLSQKGSQRFGDVFLTPASLEMLYQPTLFNGSSFRAKFADGVLQGYNGKSNARLTQPQVMRLLSTPGKCVSVVVTPVFLYNYERRVGIHWRLKQIRFNEEDVGDGEKSADSDWSF
jgi:hypothetical protein